MQKIYRGNTYKHQDVEIDDITTIDTEKGHKIQVDMNLTTAIASRWLLMMLALILLGVMHIVLPSTGGSCADLPAPLLVWCVLLVAMVG